MSDEERELELQKIQENLKITAKKFPKTQNLEYAILKGHIIIEHAIVQYIRCFSKVYMCEINIGSSFNIKLEVAYMLGFGANDPLLLPTVRQMNRIRNDVAHKFTFDRSQLDEILKLNSEDYDNLKIVDDKDRIKRLRGICSFICGYVSGFSYGSFVGAVASSDQ